MNYYSPVVVQNPDLAWREALTALHAAGGKKWFLVGFGPEPLFVPESALHAHVYVVGPSNAGKTSRVLVPLTHQAILAGNATWFLDCKSDPLIYGHMREAAREAGRKIHFFSLQPGIPSEFSIDFFAALRLAKRTPRQITEILIGSLGLNQAAEPYFVSQNAGALRVALERALQNGHVGFKSLAHELRGVVNGKDERYKNATHALDALEALADVAELNPSRNGSGGPSAMDFVNLVKEGAVCYFCLPVTTEQKLASATVASLLLKLAAVVSKDLAIAGTQTERMLFVIDEFQEVAATSDLKDLVAQVRGLGAGISLLLSHQVPEQVEDRGLQALLKSAGVLVMLAPRQFATEIQEWSGEKVVMLRSEGRSSGRNSSADGVSWSDTHSVSYQETIRPALDLNLIQEVNARPGFAFVVVGGGVPQPLFFPHHVPHGVALQRSAAAFARPMPVKAIVQPTAPAIVNAPAPPAVASPVVPLSKRLSVLGSRVRRRVFVSALRSPP